VCRVLRSARLAQQPCSLRPRVYPPADPSLSCVASARRFLVRVVDELGERAGGAVLLLSDARRNFPKCNLLSQQRRESSCGKTQPKQPLGFGGQTRDARVRSAKLRGTHKIGPCEFQKDSVEPHAHRLQGLYAVQCTVEVDTAYGIDRKDIRRKDILYYYRSILTYQY